MKGLCLDQSCQGNGTGKTLSNLTYLTFDGELSVWLLMFGQRWYSP